MSQIAKLFDGSSLPDLEKITPDVGGAVTADAAFNINLLTGDGLTSTGNPATHTITLTNDGSFNQQVIIYVGKHGNDANSGLNINVAKLTFGAAITAAVATGANVVCLDGGTYTENLVGQTGVNIFAPDATIIGSHTLVSGIVWHFGFANVNNGTTGFTFNNNGGFCRVILGYLNLIGTGVGFNLLDGSMDVYVEDSVLDNGKFVWVSGAAGGAERFQLTLGNVVITSGGVVVTCSAPSTPEISVLANMIDDQDRTGQLVVCDGVNAIISFIISTLRINTLSNVAALPSITVIAGQMRGLLQQIGGGAIDAFVTGNRIDGVPIGANLANTGRFTTLAASLTSHGILLGNGVSALIQATAEPSNGQLLIGKTGDFPQLATITQGPGTSITNGAGTITIGSVGGGLLWSTKGASTALVANNGFIANAGAGLSFSLPATSAVGDIVALTLDGAASWTITQGAGQQIRFGSVQTTLGVGGSLSSTASGDSVHLVCSVANLKWNVISSIGNITHV